LRTAAHQPQANGRRQLKETVLSAGTSGHGITDAAVQAANGDFVLT
jgi:hypothetical protein